MSARREKTKKEPAAHGQASKKIKGEILNQLMAEAEVGWSRSNARRQLNKAATAHEMRVRKRSIKDIAALIGVSE